MKVILSFLNSFDLCLYATVPGFVCSIVHILAVNKPLLTFDVIISRHLRYGML